MDVRRLSNDPLARSPYRVWHIEENNETVKVIRFFCPWISYISADLCHLPTSLLTQARIGVQYNYSQERFQLSLSARQ